MFGAAAGAAIALVLATAPAAAAQGWPAKPVRVVISFPPGGGTDILARLLARKLTEALGQTFVPENRAGAGGLVGAEVVAKAPADGHTLLVTTASLSVNASLHRKIAFDPLRDLAPVSWLSSVPLLLVVHPSVPARSVKQLVALAKERPGAMNAASNGNGTTSHLALEMLKQATGIEVVHIPYKGGGPAQVALLTGDVDFRFTTMLASIGHLRAGKVRALAVTTRTRSSVLPELPPLAATYPGFDVDQWYAMFVPAGTAREIVDRLHAETVKALGSPEVREFLRKDGAEPVGSTPAQLATFFTREVAKYAKVIAAANVRVE